MHASVELDAVNGVGEGLTSSAGANAAVAAATADEDVVLEAAGEGAVGAVEAVV